MINQIMEELNLLLDHFLDSCEIIDLSTETEHIEYYESFFCDLEHILSKYSGVLLNSNEQSKKSDKVSKIIDVLLEHANKIHSDHSDWNKWASYLLKWEI